jgi:methanogenic corrinoid protein MtbC1
VSSPTPPFTPAPSAARPSGPAKGAIAEELARSEGSRTVGLIRSSPPEEVLEQMARADAIHEALRERGYRVGFALSADGASLRIELRDRSGELLQTLSADEAVELAAGRPLE